MAGGKKKKKSHMGSQYESHVLDIAEKPGSLMTAQ